MSKIDPNKISFDDWVKFVFDHPVTKPKWYWDPSWSDFWEQWSETSDPNKQLRYATRLFRSPAFLLKEYSLEQINQGLSLLIGGPNGFRLADLIWSKKLPWRARKDCILSTVSLFQTLFAKIPEQDVCFMWWDVLRDWDHRADRDPKIRDIMFEALSLVLEIPSPQCQMSALHGLGHLKHSGTEKLVDNYRQQNPKLEEDIKKYTQVVMKGKVL